MGRSIFFEKNLRIQFDVVFYFESNGGIFDSLALFGGELWRFEICATPTAYAKIFLGNFFVSIGRVKNSTCTAQVFIDFHYYNDPE